MLRPSPKKKKPRPPNKERDCSGSHISELRSSCSVPEILEAMIHRKMEECAIAEGSGGGADFAALFQIRGSPEKAACTPSSLLEPKKTIHVRTKFAAVEILGKGQM
ncbi:hypothetical protein MRB53_009606 [Persea americana]|uniref:Uncharacterized protein n=1 Tax=Persea americana TaxID=3435 RepID=A0ACC2LQL5_PERAE|nr:hypothetical protein MRB53_009606 [Persea americana]